MFPKVEAKKNNSLLVNLICILVSMLLICGLAFLVMNVPKLTKIDFKILHFLQNTLSFIPISVPTFISFLGSYPFLYWPRITISAIMFSHKHYLNAILLFYIVELADTLNEQVIKYAVGRERPCGPIMGYSFTSGHCNFNMCLFGIILYLTIKYVKTPLWRWVIIGYSTIFLSVVGLSRMQLNVHFFTDVVAGYLLGFIFVNIYIIIDKLTHKQ